MHRLMVFSILVVLAAACGGDNDAERSDGSAATTVASDAGEGPSSDSNADNDADVDDGGGGEDETGGTSIDGSSIDWATVDLTSIDWANIDLSTLDFPALEANPTADTLSAETLSLIQGRLAERAGSGHATLTIGDQTWEFEGFVCAIGYANTESDLFSLSTNAFGTHSDGARLQMQADIADSSGEDRLTGAGLDHSSSSTTSTILKTP